MAQLREARREMELREFFARERLLADVADTFTLDNLLSMVAPPGSLVERVISGVGTGFAALQGIIGVVGGLFGRQERSSGHRAPSRRARSKK